MSTTTKTQSTKAASEKFQAWFESPKENVQVESSTGGSPSQNNNIGNGQTLTFENVRIDFPLRPYPAQVQMMKKIIHTLNESENALLESPTGSGKSLALLCAALAWRENEERLVAERITQSKRTKVLQETKPDNNKGVIEISDNQPKMQGDFSIIQSVPDKKSISIDDDFKDDKSAKRPIDSKNDPKNWKKRFRCNDDNVITVEDDSFEDFQVTAALRQKPVNNENKPPGLQLKANPEDVNSLKYQTFKSVPRIFVGSRTHKQITQLVKELKSKTRYSPRTTILGSREHLCIHPDVSKSNNKTEDCVELLDKSACTYASRTHGILSHRTLKTTNRIWDIEDIVTLGKKTRGCPYYASRKLYEGAEVIFCPYNYIIDPTIRKILDINLKNSIIILDEAHNIEDSSRSAGSFEVDEQVLSVIKKELEQIIRNGIEVQSHSVLELVIDGLFDWITSSNNVFNIKEYESHYCHWTGAEIIQKLKDANITPHVFQESIRPAYKVAAAHAEQIRKETENNGLGETNEVEDLLSSQVRIHHRKCLSNNCLSVIQGIFMVFGLLFEEEKNYAKDYQMVLSKRIERSSNFVLDQGRRRKKNDRASMRPQWSFKLGFKCLNPGVIFRDMTKTTRSVILTSGTLSPLNTFASELETKFEGRLEANHVIDKSQVWVGAIPRGPNRFPLKGVFSNMEKFDYQDDIGESLCQIVEAVPFGVLCFMPSYNTLDRFIQRWKMTGMYDRLLARKMIISEPKGSDKKDFENAIGTFYKQVDDVQVDVDEEGRDGALFFAVFRGKVSEGIDFTDNYCRAVVTVGIPYPSVKDMEVKFKKEYNDRRRSELRNCDILSSNEWYSAQAFRAINQALGRCIRHKNDWGAIIMLEERFGQGKVVQGLSKWVRNQFQIYPEFPLAISGLQDFVKRQIEKTSSASSLDIKAPLIPFESNSPAVSNTTTSTAIPVNLSNDTVSTSDTSTTIHTNRLNPLAITQSNDYNTPIVDHVSHQQRSVTTTLSTSDLTSSSISQQNSSSLLNSASSVNHTSYSTTNVSNHSVNSNHTAYKNTTNNSSNPIHHTTINHTPSPIAANNNSTLRSNSTAPLSNNNTPPVSKIVSTYFALPIQPPAKPLVNNTFVAPVVNSTRTHSHRSSNSFEDNMKLDAPTTEENRSVEYPFQIPSSSSKVTLDSLFKDPILNNKNLPSHSPAHYNNQNFKTLSTPARTKSTTLSRNDLYRVGVSIMTDHRRVNVSCSLCKNLVLNGALRHLGPVEVNDLTLITENKDFKHKELVEVSAPGLWKTTSNLAGGPIDVKLLPNEATVTLNRKDEVCYRVLGCACSTHVPQGIFICEDFKDSREFKYTGRVFIWLTQLIVEKEVENSRHQGDNNLADQLDIPSSQVPSMNDFFYHL